MRSSSRLDRAKARIAGCPTSPARPPEARCAETPAHRAPASMTIALTATTSAASTPTLSPVIEKAEAAKSGPEANPIAARKNSSPS